MSEFENWLLEKQAATKILPAELVANAGKIKAAQNPKKPGAEKPDLYAKGKGRGKGGKLVGKKAKKKRKWIPSRKKLEGPNLGKTRTEKISSFREDEIFAGSRDDIDREFVGWNLEKSAAYTTLDMIDARRNMAMGGAIAAPIAFGAGIAAKTAWDLFKKRRADEAEALIASSQEPVPPSLAKQAKLTDVQKGMAHGALVEGVRAAATGALPAVLIAPKGRRLSAAARGAAYSLAGRSIGGKVDEFAGSPTGMGDAGGTIGGVAAGLQARNEARKEKKKKEREKNAESAQARVSTPATGGSPGLGKLMAGATSPAAGGANALANVTRKLTGGAEKKAAFVQHEDNMELLKRILSKSGTKSVDA